MKTITITAVIGEAPTVKLGRTFTMYGEVWAIHRPTNPVRKVGWQVSHLETTFGAGGGIFKTMDYAEDFVRARLEGYGKAKVIEAVARARLGNVGVSS